MSTPNSPKLLKGAIVGVDILKPAPAVIPFQYNPHTLTRSIKPRGMSEEGATSEAQRLTGAPEETIQVEIEIDATDRLETGDGTTLDLGIYPQLAALETLVYPFSGAVIANAVLAAAGVIEVVPHEGPFTLFIWGPKRIVPVRIAEMTVTEEAFDQTLAPLRARVSLGLRVLSYHDLPLTHPGYHVFMAHQIVKEVFAEIGKVNDLSAVAGADVGLF